MDFIGTVLVFLFTTFQISCSVNSVWHYECIEKYCVKRELTRKTLKSLSLAECNLLCLDAAGLWPKPTGVVMVYNLTEITIKNFKLDTKQNTSITSLVNKAFHILISQLNETIPSDHKNIHKRKTLNKVVVHVVVNNKKHTKLTFETDESYGLTIFQVKNDLINVSIEAETFFGARHGLETLGQLVIYDDIRDRVLLPNTVSITDRPTYKWRGLLLDTSRNFIPVAGIKRTLKAMAASKMNTFHWHLTDSASFPYVSLSRPELSLYGSYSPKKVYTDKDIRSIIRYAKVRGIRVVPELDAPAHVGEGWQKFNVVTCFNWHPWTKYCSEPPCGQFDPSNDNMYDILEDVYGDMLKQFGTEIFHMGGDEVNINCWNKTKSLTNWMTQVKGWNLTNDDFIDNVWGYFQTEASKRLYKKAGKEIPIILWTSELTASEKVRDILPPDKYFIQVWFKELDLALDNLLDKNYTLILSNYDRVYLDCGFESFTSSEDNWCSPYKNWKLLYENKPINIVGSRKNQILGGEAALWTETAGPGSLDSRIWPRTAALAEALWTESSTFWTDAEERMLLHRERLINLGIDADSLEPEWCLQNQQNCPVNGKAANFYFS